MKRVLFLATLAAVLAVSVYAYAEQEEVELPQVEPGSKFDPQWDQVPPGAPREVTVVEGDTLWDLCEKHLGNPWFWPKVWKLNPQIANPHWIYPGNVIKMLPDDFRPGEGYQTAAAEGEVEGVEEGEGEEGEGEAEEEIEEIEEDRLSDLIFKEDIEEDTGDVYELGKSKREFYRELLAKQRNMENLRRDGFISTDVLKASGEIVSSPSEHQYLAEGDTVFVDFHKKATAVGEEYQIYRVVGEVEHPKTGDLVGYKVQILGKLQIEALGKPYHKAKIVDSYSEIQRGDLLRPWRNPYRRIIRRPNKKSLKGYIVDRLGDDDYLAEWSLVYIDKGINDGIEEGNHLTVMRKGEALVFTGVDLDIDRDKLPEVPIAELIVVSAGRKTAAAIVWKSLMEVKVGDKFVMKKD